MYTERVIGRRLTLHSLRHTNASLLFEQKVSLEAVAARLGHKDSEITKKIYLHITKRLQDEYNKEVEKVRIL